ncbi:serine hydrolase domain-containing protein [Phytopseudomonas flavescens]|uniref:serine hydrolase domain-containing protein n=1 Tax=Phytopseudomonas flavescens TaxID=29435 RepID=UPI000B8211E8|nr:serine hydrolase domain-containing protein [Pseudomonas flavescens]
MACSLVVNGLPSAADRQGPLVPWWSFTKTVLAATALTLVRDGLVSLDEAVLGGPFTLRQLLKHESGLADYSELADYHAAVARGDQPWPASEMLERLDATRLRYPPGGGWGYSNVGYLYVTRLIQERSGTALENAIRQRVLQPLGVPQVRLAKTPAELRDVEMGGAASYHPGWVYHGLLVGSVSAAALLLERLLGGDLLPAELLAQMQARRVLGGPIAGRPWTVAGYALGLMQGDIEGGIVLGGHTGGGPGSVIAVYRCATENATASAAVFQAGARDGDVEAEVVARLLGALG